MKNGESEKFNRLAQETAAVEAAARRAVRKALQDHKRTGDPIVVFKDDEVRWIPADEIRVPPVAVR
jgi:alpha-D-ribose 1-methylphosphonate 5-triphosphate synthase subunit PhnL